MPVSELNSYYIACRKMASQKMNQDVAHACNTESRCNALNSPNVAFIDNWQSNSSHPHTPGSPLACKVFLCQLLWFSSFHKTNMSKLKFNWYGGPAWKPAKANVASSLNIVNLLFYHSVVCGQLVQTLQTNYQGSWSG